MSGEWTWTERLLIYSELCPCGGASSNIFSSTVITKMQRWLNLSRMSSFPLLSALFLSPAGRNLPTLLRTSTKYDPLQRKLASARSDHRRWVFLKFQNYSCFVFFNLFGILASALVDNSAGKVVFLDRFQHGGLRLRVKLSASLSSDCVVFATTTRSSHRRANSGGNPCPGEVWTSKQSDMSLL